LPFREAWAAAPFGEQALANLEKLFSLAEAWDRRRPGDLDGFAQELVSLASAEPREAQADAFDLDDPRAIQILTVHQSKGLEWPVVVVPNLASTTTGGTEPWFFDRTLGFALKVRQPDGAMAHTPRTKRISKELSRRAAAESRRTLYVALTRARDRLILSGRAKREANSWRAMVQGWIPEAEAAGQLGWVEPRPLAPGAPRGDGGAATSGALTEALARVRAPLPPSAGDWVLPVTRLELFAQCPRRYWLTAELGLEEPAPRTVAPQGAAGADHAARAVDTARPDGAGGREAAMLRGTLAHRLLEQVDLRLSGEERTHALGRLVERNGLDPAAPDVAEVLAWVERFLAGDWGRRLAGEGVHRELPFVLRVPAGPVALCLKGKIDLLIEEPDGVTVLDYKTARGAPGDEAYAFQLGCYALAATAWCRPGGAVRTGIVPLRQDAPVVLERRTDLDAVEAGLGSLARSLVEAVTEGEWEGRAKAHCQAIGCGFVSRCHKEGAAL
jgi:ATP-dependent exoDNAse (exonuclease V) beta subunit